jgi:hypothetical protein
MFERGRDIYPAISPVSERTIFGSARKQRPQIWWSKINPMGDAGDDLRLDQGLSNDLIRLNLVPRNSAILKLKSPKIISCPYDPARFGLIIIRSALTSHLLLASASKIKISLLDTKSDV